MSEETLWQQNIMSERLWIIDPLDGTNNFAHSIPHYSISVAYAEKGEVKVAVIYDPNRDELFTAESGRGAFCNGEKILVSQSKSLKESVIATGFYYERGEMMQNTLFSIFRLFGENIQGIRRMGSAALDLSWVACGRYDGYFEYKLSPWDFAAGMLLVKEAGGVFSDRDGMDQGLRSQGVICSNRCLYEDILRLVKWSSVSKEKQLVLR
jgi:myo-inositol-1(or 4)-monophosphatase